MEVIKRVELYGKSDLPKVIRANEELEKQMEKTGNIRIGGALVCQVNSCNVGE